ncbi:MAG: Gfo/Idh/MocA family oxidoreductase, partial [Acidobacteriaceae bacterium]|nr:Gfo/Idh/MocA family oxidoreductase [Acidobacteriaceae bacterium]
MRPLAVAIIGCGRMGRERARCARQLGHRVLYVVDTNHARALELAVEYDARVLPGASECFAAGVDLVFLCTPAGSRGSLLEQCLQHKVPFLVEKPIGVSGVPYAELANRLSSSRLIHAVGFMNRYRRSVQWAKALLAHRNLLALQAHWICGPYRVPWVNDETLSGGP